MSNRKYTPGEKPGEEKVTPEKKVKVETSKKKKADKE